MDLLRGLAFLEALEEFQGVAVDRLLPVGLGRAQVEGLEPGVELEPGLADLGLSIVASRSPALTSWPTRAVTERTTPAALGVM